MDKAVCVEPPTEEHRASLLAQWLPALSADEHTAWARAQLAVRGQAGRTLRAAGFDFFSCELGAVLGAHRSGHQGALRAEQQVGGH
jgi:hypothetical protein